jgi:hypothetical protein
MLPQRIRHAMHKNTRLYSTATFLHVAKLPQQFSPQTSCNTVSRFSWHEAFGMGQTNGLVCRQTCTPLNGILHLICQELCLTVIVPPYTVHAQSRFYKVYSPRRIGKCTMKEVGLLFIFIVEVLYLLRCPLRPSLLP